jgi:capsular exopolysaccharide synthesis family protein
MVRAHAVWGLVVAAAVFGLLLRSAVPKPDIYESHALVQLSVRNRRTAEDLLATLAAVEPVTETPAELMTLRSRDLAQAAVIAPGSRLRALVRPVSDRTWGAWFEALSGALVPHTHIVAAMESDGGVPVQVRVIFRRRANGAWQIEQLQDGSPVVLAEGFRFREPWDDSNRNGSWDEPEPYVDANGDGRYNPPEPFDDANGDGVRNRSEAFDDLDGDGLRDGDEPFTDLNADGRWTPGEPFEDLDGNGRWSADEPFTDLDGDGRRRDGEPFDDRDQDGHHDVAEPFVDLDGDGFWRRFDETFVDTDGDGEWGAGETFTDRDGDAQWSEGEAFEDQDGSGTWDPGTALELGGSRLYLTRMVGELDGAWFDIRVQTLQDAVDRVVGSIAADEVVPYSDVARVMARDSHPYHARDIVQGLVDAFVARKQSEKVERALLLLEWLRRESHVTARRLMEAYRRRDDYVRREGAVLLAERAEAAFLERSELARERLQLEFDMRRVEDQLRVLQEERPALELLAAVATGDVDPRTTSLLDERTAAQMELGRLAQHGHSKGSMEFDDVRARLDQLDGMLQESVHHLVREQTKALSGERTRLTAKLEHVIARERVQSDLLHDLPRLEQGLMELGRPIASYERIGQDLARWQSEAEIGRAGTSPPVRVLEAAVTQATPVAPNRLLDLVIAILAAVAAGIGACWLREYLDRRIRNARQLEMGLGRPLAGAVPAFQSVPRRERPRRRRPTPALTRPGGLLAEAYRKLRASIRHEHREAPVRIFSITSPVQGDGKSITALNLGVTMARAGERVLIIDGDLRRPSMHELVGRDRSPGLHEILQGQIDWRDAVGPGPAEGLFVITAGASGEFGHDLLESDAMVRLLEEVRAAYDTVMVDVPPVLAVSDAMAFFHRLDGVFLLVRAGRYSVDVAAEAIELIERSGGRMRGVILNAFDARLAARRGAAYYGYRYGARYAYR